MLLSSLQSILSLRGEKTLFFSATEQWNHLQQVLKLSSLVQRDHWKAGESNRGSLQLQLALFHFSSFLHCKRTLVCRVPSCMYVMFVCKCFLQPHRVSMRFLTCINKGQEINTLTGADTELQGRTLHSRVSLTSLQRALSLVTRVETPVPQLREH